MFDPTPPSTEQTAAPASGGAPLRAWQRRALTKYLVASPKDFLAVATPGAGKTTFALRVAAELLARPSTSLAETKALMRDVPALLEHMQREIEVFADRLRSPESAEALAAFQEKRRPDFAQFE